MKRYLVKVVLPDASENDYAVLHSIMEANGFKQQLHKAGENPVNIDLPQGQYAIAEAVTADHLFLRVKTLIGNALPCNNVFISNCSLYWGDLDFPAD